MATNSRGLTLIEVLVALLITSVLALVGYQSLSTAASSSEGIANATDDLVAVQVAMSMLEDDLSEFRLRDITDEYGERRGALEAGVSSEYLLNVSRGGRYRSQRQVATSLERVRYRFESGELWRDSWYQLDRVRSEPSNSQRLLGELSDVSIRFYLKDGGRIASYDSWDQSIAARLKVDRPSAVEVTIQRDTLGELKLLVNLN